MINTMDRNKIIKRRRELSLDYRLKASDEILQKLTILDEYKNAESVLAYADANGEVMTDKLILTAMLAGKKVYAPLCGEDFSMDFYRIHSLDDLYPGAYGIREPAPVPQNELTESVVSDDTLIIVPGVMFDKNGNRMGYGKGYYDRYLSRMNIKHRIGIAYDFQIMDALDVKATDVPMTLIITDKD